MKVTEAGCLCGAVRVKASGEARRVGLCHCLECRKHHGAVFYAAAVFCETQVTIVGVTKSYRGRHFCPECGSSVFARTGSEVEIHLGAMDNPNQYRPKYELWCKRREAWLPDFSGVIQYEANRADPLED